MSQELPPNATPVTTEQMFAIIGELFVQVRILQAMLNRQLETDKANGLVDAIKERSIQN